MPCRNPRPCMHKGCNRLTTKGRYCSIHYINTQHFRNTAEWKRISAQVLLEEPICRLCNEPSTDCDHIIPLPIGTDDRSNLQGLCHKHHSIKTRKETSR